MSDLTRDQGDAFWLAENTARADVVSLDAFQELVFIVKCLSEDIEELRGEIASLWSKQP